MKTETIVAAITGAFTVGVGVFAIRLFAKGQFGLATVAAGVAIILAIATLRYSGVLPEAVDAGDGQ